jgi:hypothetical protein
MRDGVATRSDDDWVRRRPEYRLDRARRTFTSTPLGRPAPGIIWGRGYQPVNGAGVVSERLKVNRPPKYGAVQHSPLSGSGRGLRLPSRFVKTRQLSGSG